MSSRDETIAHIVIVKSLIHTCVENLLFRAEAHDQSKLHPPELTVLDGHKVSLENIEYGSKEYEDNLIALKVALDHHYKCNSHHPQHYIDGIKGMDLLDILEMLLDWKASGLRHKLKPGNILDSIELNQKKFGYSDELKQIFINTIKHLGLE